MSADLTLQTARHSPILLSQIPPSRTNTGARWEADALLDVVVYCLEQYDYPQRKAAGARLWTAVCPSHTLRLPISLISGFSSSISHPLPTSTSSYSSHQCMGGYRPCPASPLTGSPSCSPLCLHRNGPLGSKSRFARSISRHPPLRWTVPSVCVLPSDPNHKRERCAPPGARALMAT